MDEAPPMFVWGMNISVQDVRRLSTLVGLLSGSAAGIVGATQPFI